MALFHTTVVDNQIKALDTIGSASGAIATFDTDRAENLINLEVAITATQSGSGTPSPSNPRTINGFSACNQSVNGTTETIPFGQTVYGGRLNVGSGVLTVTEKYFSYTEVLYYGTYGSDNANLYYMAIPDYNTEKIKNISNATYTGVLLSNMLSKITSTTVSAMHDNEIRTQGNLAPQYFYFRADSFANLADLNAFIANTPLQVVAELETPLTIQLDSKQIQAIIGTNNIYADTGDIIDLKFVLSVGKAIS